jgi:hypothetical protein
MFHVADRPMPARHVRCPNCGDAFLTGFPLKRHRASCGPRPPVHEELSPFPASNGDDEWSCDTDPASESDLFETCAAACPPDAPFVTCLNEQGEAPGMSQCLGWGPKNLTPQEEETFRFLQVVDAGSGTSTRVAQGMLPYARRLGGLGLLLPQTIRACWSSLAKVPIFDIVLNFKFQMYFSTSHNFKS